MVPLIPVNLAAICIESFLYGIFFVLSITSIYLLVHRHKALALGVRARGSVLRSPMFHGSIYLLIIITSHWSVNITRLFQAFVHFKDGSSPFAFYSDLSQVSEVVKTGLVPGTLLIGDSMIIYRLWIVWDYSISMIVFPVCTLMGLAASGIGITHQLTRYTPGQDVFLSSAGLWITSLCSFTLCTNVYSTVMIAWRVWNTNRSVRSFGGTSLLPVIATLVESAAIYTTWTIFFFVAYQTNSNLQYVAVDSMPVMSGIAFTLITVRVGMGWAQRAHHCSISAHINNELGEQQRYSLTPVAVNITRVVNSDCEREGDQSKDDRSDSEDVKSRSPV